ncbi:MAG: DUF2071 domain-containing protein [Niabella sp.]
MSNFLKAEWRRLAMANYAVDPSVLQPYLPYKTELDLWKNACFVSLVGFMFLNTRLLGIKVPGHVNFEEVNLRFYVRYKENNKWKRGVVFIKEIVPKPALAFVANTLYHENYEAMSMKHFWTSEAEKLSVSYSWKKRDWHLLTVTAHKIPHDIEAGSGAEFITEHYWGYTKINRSKTSEYEVQHPRWQVYDVLDYKINVNFGVLYGKAFSFLSRLQPTSVFLAEGSFIEVKTKRTIR